MTAQTIPSDAQPEILIVEDSPVEAEMLRRILVRAGYRVVLVKNGEKGLQALREHPCALVMSDIIMPLMSGYELCRAIKLDEKLWSTPVILVTVLSEPKDIIMALEVGAEGYITKPYVEGILLGRIRSLLSNPIRRKLAEERRTIRVEYGGEKCSVVVGGQQMANLLLSVYENSLMLNAKLEELAMRDGLTNLLNHRTFYTLLEKEVARTQRYDKPLALLMLDIDHFKRVNDTHGHVAGDMILAGLSSVVSSQMRNVDSACRYGGEEISVILPETGMEAAAQVAERIRSAIEQHRFEIGQGQSITITVSIGVASLLHRKPRSKNWWPWRTRRCTRPRKAAGTGCAGGDDGDFTVYMRR